MLITKFYPFIVTFAFMYIGIQNAAAIAVHQHLALTKPRYSYKSEQIINYVHNMNQFWHIHHEILQRHAAQVEQLRLFELQQSTNRLIQHSILLQQELFKKSQRRQELLGSMNIPLTNTPEEPQKRVPRILEEAYKRNRENIQQIELAMDITNAKIRYNSIRQALIQRQLEKEKTKQEKLIIVTTPKPSITVNPVYHVSYNTPATSKSDSIPTASNEKSIRTWNIPLLIATLAILYLGYKYYYKQSSAVIATH